MIWPLDLAHNYLGKTDPQYFGRLTKLLVLNLTDNGIKKFTARHFGRNQLLSKYKIWRFQFELLLKNTQNLLHYFQIQNAYPILKGVPKNFWILLFLAIFSSNLHQIQKVRSVLISAHCQLFKTVLTFDFCPSRSWDIGARTHQGSFLFFT